MLSKNLFSVVYPTKMEFARLRNIRSIQVKGKESIMHFEECVNSDVQRYDLIDLWVRVRGCLDELRKDYLALFAIGSLIVKTKEVDMVFTRAHKVVRLKVACAEPSAIPPKIGHTYDGVGYMLRFSIENDNGEDVIMDDADLDDDTKGDDK